jgi:hypothetical protein
MSIYDEIKFDYELPFNLTGSTFQTKDTPSQCLDNYKIDKDGVLWVERYNIEIDKNKFENNEIRGLLKKINKIWVPLNNFIGGIKFYIYEDEKLYVFSSYFVNGILKELHFIENER